VELLQTLGASPAQLQRFLMRQFMPVNAAIVAVVLVLLVALQFVFHHTLQQAGMYVLPYISWTTLLAAAATIAVFWVSNRRTIERFIRS
jgi:tryptophan-rich sensory protein